MELTYDAAVGRYVCSELVLRQSAAVTPSEPVTTEAIRQVQVAQEIVLLLLVDSPLRDLPNPDGVEPWGRTLPEGLAKEEGPTDRVLRWVGHLYKYALAVEYPPTKAVEEKFRVSRPTAGRWVSAARREGFLGPAEAGKAGWATEEDARLAEARRELTRAHNRHVAAAHHDAEARRAAEDAERALHSAAADAAMRADEVGHARAEMERAAALLAVAEATAAKAAEAAAAAEEEGLKEAHDGER